MVISKLTYFVEVLLPISVYKSFTYRVPFELNEILTVGCRVVVPFGKAKLLTGIIIEIHENPPKDYTAKYVESVLDDFPIVTKNQLNLWNWIAEYYMAPIGDVMNAALPSNFKLGSETKVLLHPNSIENSEFLNDSEYQVYEALEIQGELTLKEIGEILQIKTVQPVIKKLIDKRVVITLEEVQKKYEPKTKTFISLSAEFNDENTLENLLNEKSKSNQKVKQVNTILSYLNLIGNDQDKTKPILRKQVEQTGGSLSSINTLVKEGVFEIKNLEVSRIGGFGKTIVPTKELSEGQKKALDEIEASFEQNDVVLLHGVTGSGKTEIYVELIQKEILKGKQVLFLIPEIALTTQLIDRLSDYFGDKIGVYHSRFNQNERIEIWNSLLDPSKNKFDIIVGARSSVFLPFQNLGLIIVDEEHEQSFKQFDPSPRYNGRDVAIVLRSIHQSKILLGSATPSFESYFNAKSGKYGLVELNKRFGSVLMPEIMTANIQKEKRNKSMHAEFSSFLLTHIQETLQREEQIILFQNRRGYNPMWSCEVCGWVPECKNCDVSLTYHKQKNSLICHYCGFFSAPLGSCNSCGSNRLRMVGFGTEKIEDELKLLFPDVRVQRMDLDSTREKSSYQRIINEFDSGNVDILVGTQMISKGLDFGNVTLVGILDADMMLRRPDFRAFERSYQLMSQVAGRAGRKLKQGKVIIQTFDPDNWVIQHVMEHDFKGFYQNEIVERNNYKYPPYFKLIEITIKHRKLEELNLISEDFATRLTSYFGDRILGPEFPIVNRIHNYYLKIIRIKFEKNISQKKVKSKIFEIMNDFFKNPVNKGCKISIDVDPI